MKLTKEQAIIITGYTGVAACNFGDFQEDVERRLGRPVWTHEFGSEGSCNAKAMEALYRKDFLAICHEDTPTPTK